MCRQGGIDVDVSIGCRNSRGVQWCRPRPPSPWSRVGLGLCAITTLFLLLLCCCTASSSSDRYIPRALAGEATIKEEAARAHLKDLLGHLHSNLPVLPVDIDNDQVFLSPPLFRVHSLQDDGSGSGNTVNTTATKFIPQIVHIAMRNKSHAVPTHHAELKLRNPNWEFRYSDNADKDRFMEKHFANTSLLWAYSLLNPEIGASRPEIWRLCVLYMYGGLYMDDDATIRRPLDRVVNATDKFIVGEEGYDVDNRCYIDEFVLSMPALSKKYGNKTIDSFFDHKFLHNWALFSSPGHPILRRTLHHIVTLISAEYERLSLIKMHPSDHRGKLLQCATTYPLTFSAMEIVLEGRYKDTGTGTDKGEGRGVGAGTSRDALGVVSWPPYDYESDIKAWNNDFAPDRWHKMMQKHNKKYLIAYEHKPKDRARFSRIYDLLFSGRLIQGTGQHEIFLYLNGSKHAFPNWDSFVESGYDLVDVKAVPVESLGALVTGNDVDQSNIYFRKETIAQMKASRTVNMQVIGEQWDSEQDGYGQGSSAGQGAHARVQRQRQRGLRGSVQQAEAEAGAEAGAEEVSSSSRSSSSSSSSSRRRRSRSRSAFTNMAAAKKLTDTNTLLADSTSSYKARRRRLRKYSDDNHPAEQLFTPTKKNGMKYGAEELSDAERTVVLTKRVEASMIFDRLNASEVNLIGNRKHNNSVHFLQTLFDHKANGLHVTVQVPTENAASAYDPSNDPGLFQFRVWPGVFTGDCPGYHPDVRQDHTLGADRGMILAHRSVWEEFATAREGNPERMKISEKNDIMLVFEDDPYPMVENHQLNTWLEINRMKSDLHWLGWCYYHEDIHKAPLCMHAYAMTVAGAKDLLRNIEPCGPLPLDRQVRNMCAGKNGTTWSFTDGEIEYRTIHSNYFRNRMSDAGIYVTELMHYGGYGGIYTQAKFESPALDDPIIKDRVVVVKNKKHKPVYLCINGSLHVFSDFDVFVDMGYKWGQVYHMSNWKFNTLRAVGAPVSQEFCRNNQCKIGPLLANVP